MMGANFEIETVSRQFIPIEVVQPLFRVLELTFIPEYIECIDDWEWHDPKVLPVDETDVMQLVTDGHIVFLYGTAAGVHFSKEEDTFHTGLWFDVSLKPELENGLISERERVCHLIERFSESFAPYEPVCTAMGVEMYFNYHGTETETLADSVVDHLIWHSVSG